MKGGGEMSLIFKILKRTHTNWFCPRCGCQVESFDWFCKSCGCDLE